MSVNFDTQKRYLAANNINTFSTSMNPMVRNAQASNNLNMNNAPDSISLSNKTEVSSKLRAELNKTKKQQGLFGNVWDGFKNLTGIGASSNKAQKAITDFEKGKISKTDMEKAVKGYEDGQKMCVDVAADMISGFAAVGAIALAPFTGGASLLLAAGVGAGVKVGIKGGDAILTGKGYDAKDLAYDAVTGSINGVMGPLTSGIGGVVGTGVAKAFGLDAVEQTAKTAMGQVAKTTGEEALEKTTEQGIKQTSQSLISKILVKGGSKYVVKAGTKTLTNPLASKIAAYGSDMIISGALAGAADGFARALGEGRLKDIPKDTINGFVGGAIASPIVGGGFRAAGKAGLKIGENIFNNAEKNATKDVSDKTEREIAENLFHNNLESKTKTQNVALEEAALDKIGKNNNTYSINLLNYLPDTNTEITHKTVFSKNANETKSLIKQSEIAIDRDEPIASTSTANKLIGKDVLKKRQSAFDNYFAQLRNSEEADEIINHISSCSSSPYFSNKEQLIQNFPWEELSEALPHPSNYNDIEKIIASYIPTKDTSFYGGLSKLYENGTFPRYIMSSTNLIQHWTPKANEFPFEQIKNTAIFKKMENNPVLINNLLMKIKNSDFDSSKIVSNTNFLSDENLETHVKKLVNNPNLNKSMQQIFDINNMKVDTLNDLLLSNLTQKQVDNSIKQMSKSLKLALKTPNQYLSNIPIEYTTKVGGKYPTLPAGIMESYQNDVTKFFQKNSSKILRTLNYIDNDTLNQMMDRRFSLFEDKLDELNELSDTNFELLSKLIKCKNPEGKALTARQKIELSQIVYATQSAALDNDSLTKMATKGTANVQELKDEILSKTLGKFGLTKSLLNSIPNDKLNFNMEYAYLLSKDSESNFQKQMEELRPVVQALRFMDKHTIQEQANQMRDMLDDASIMEQVKANGITRKDIENQIYMYENLDKFSDDEVLKNLMSLFNIMLEGGGATKTDNLTDVIRSSTLGNFKEYIHDVSNRHGAANSLTKEEFAQSGIDYYKWLHPGTENNVELNVADRNLAIKMWDRNPQEDLFMGNKTTCCTAIGTGINAAATPAYLLNTAYNVIEMHDSAGNLVGMSRVFMANVDDKPSVIMDNIELNKTFIKPMKDKELKQIRDGFFKYMNNYSKEVTGNSDSQVYFYAKDIHVPKSDLTEAQKNVNFIGQISDDTIYVNSAECSWIDPKTLGNQERPFLIVPKE